MAASCTTGYQMWQNGGFDLSDLSALVPAGKPLSSMCATLEACEALAEVTAESPAEHKACPRQVCAEAENAVIGSVADGLAASCAAGYQCCEATTWTSPAQVPLCPLTYLSAMCALPVP